jgi:uncharacterized coiled-coil protein SlyX
MAVAEGNKTLYEANRTLADANLILAKNNERLVALLERRMETDPRFAPPGTKGTETLERKKTSTKAG